MFKSKSLQSGITRDTSTDKAHINTQRFVFNAK